MLHTFHSALIFRDAVEHFLEALNIQAAGRGPMGETSNHTVSNNIWSTLRKCLNSLDMNYLIPAAESR